MSRSEQKSSVWLKCISTSGGIRGIVIQATEVVSELASIHGLDSESAQGLGEAAIAGLLISSYCKAGERINLNLQGSKRYKQALVDAYPDGTLRGYVVPREGELVSQPDTGPWGSGLMSVLRTKTLEVNKQPYIGTVPLLTGHLAKDLAYYWAQSEQVPTACGMSVAVKDGRISSAGGFLVQAMPGASPEDVRMIDEQVSRLKELDVKFAGGFSPVHLLGEIFQSVPFVVLEESVLKLDCNCSAERVLRALALVGVDEIRAMMVEDHGASVRCDFCAKEYRLTESELGALLPTE